MSDSKKSNEGLQGSVQNKKNGSLAAALLRLENKSRFLYNLLNTIVDILVKPIPIFLFMLLFKNGDLLALGNRLQNTVFFVFGVIGIYLSAIMVYLIFLLVVQIVKLFVCTYKPLVIHFRVFDVIIRLSRKKIIRENDRELNSLLYDHECIVRERMERREGGRERAYERKRQRDMEDLEYAQREYERAKDSAQWHRASAEHNYKKAKEGGTLFSSAETKRKEAGRDLQRAIYDEQDAEYYKEKMRAKERALGIKRKN